MPGISPQSTRTFHRTLYAQMLQTIRFLRRNPDQQQGTITAYTLSECRQSMSFADGETIQGDMLSNHRCVWHIPAIVLNAVGLTYVQIGDRIDNTLTGVGIGVPGVWQAESTTELIRKLFSNHYCVSCLRIDPPA